MTSVDVDRPARIAPADAPPPRPFLTAEWRSLVMLNYTINPAVLAPRVPRGLELDTFQGQCYVRVVGFLFQDARLRGWSIPRHRCFAEVNLRYYVRREVDGQLRRGVVFLKEIVARRCVSWVARWVYNESYVTYPMRQACPEPQFTLRAGDEFCYQWRRRGAWEGLSAVAERDARFPLPESLDQFIVEHYWGYSAQRDGGALEYAVEHIPWRIAPARDARLDCQPATLYGQEFAPYLTGPPASAFIADGSPVRVYRGTRVPRE